jgi:hypothetical protein
MRDYILVVYRGFLWGAALAWCVFLVQAAGFGAIMFALPPLVIGFGLGQNYALSKLGGP